MSCLCPSINASKCIEYGYGELKKAGAGEDTLSKAAAAQVLRNSTRNPTQRLQSPSGLSFLTNNGVFIVSQAQGQV